MDISTQLPEAVQWSEGMLLSPQHLQQNDIYWQQQLRHRMACLMPYYWGLVDLALSKTDLLTGVVNVERLHCVLPDGLAVQYPQAGSAPLRLDLNTCKWTDGRPLKVNLVVPVRTEGAASHNSSIQRYDSVPGALEIDENTGEGHVEVGRLRPRLSLVTGDVVPPKYTSFPLLEVWRDTSGSFGLTAFHPPMLRTGTSSFLEEGSLQVWLSTLIRQIREKAKELADESSANGEETDLAGSDANKLLYGVRRLTTALPALETLVRSQIEHPFDLYLALAHLVGNVAAIGPDAMPLNMEPYRHDDCMPGFRAALEYVEAKLEQINLAFEALLFKQVDDGTFVCKVPSDLMTGTIVVELKPRAGQGINEMTQWLRQARIANDELMPLLKQRRLPGATFGPVRREHIAGLTLRPGRALFAIHNETVELEKQVIPVIQAGRSLMIQGPASSFVPAAIILYRSKQKRAVRQARTARQPVNA